MAGMTTMSLFYVNSGPTHQEGHTLNLVFCLDGEYDDLRVRGLSFAPLSCTDHSLVSFRLTEPSNLCIGGRTTCMLHPQRLMDLLERFLNTLEKC